ncbi:MAG: UPF0033 domain-containing protein [Burkholderia sp.]|jgi:tRNA 2-thiouridine synthesizing protein A
MSEETVTEIRLPGMVCPMPVLKAKKALAKMAGGSLLRVVSTDPHSLPDLAEFCRQTRHELVSQNADREKGEYVSLIRRRAD